MSSPLDHFLKTKRSPQNIQTSKVSESEHLSSLKYTTRILRAER